MSMFVLSIAPAGAFVSSPCLKAGDSTKERDNDVVKSLDPTTVKLCQWNGKTYSLPVGTSVSILGYNKNLLQAVGVPISDPVKPMTFQEFMAMGKKLSKKGVQYAINPSDILDFDTFVRMEGGQSYDQQINPTK